jgi:uncharacterized protein YggE
LTSFTLFSSGLGKKMAGLVKFTQKTLGLSLAVAMLCLGSSSRAIAQMDSSLLRTITVTGQGDEAIATTISQVSLGVEVRGKTAEEVQSEIATRSQKLVTFLKSKKVDQLTTTGVYLQPEYNYDDGTQRLTGYIATNSVSFEVPIAAAGSIMDEAVKEGATRIDGVYFWAEDDALAAAEKIALAEAARDAKTQADAVLAALGLTAQDVVQIQVNGSQPIDTPYVKADSLAIAASAGNSAVEGGEQTVNAMVTLTIRY